MPIQLNYFWIKVAVIATCSLILTLWLPWYMIAVVAFLTGIFAGEKPGNNFLAGAVAIGGLWLIQAVWKDVANDGNLSTKIASLFSQSLDMHIATPILYFITVLIGGLIGGLSCLSGALIASDTNVIGKGRKSKKGMYKVKLKYK